MSTLSAHSMPRSAAACCRVPLLILLLGCSVASLKICRINDNFRELLEAGPKPSVAAIEGMALGGGLETAMACNARLAAPGVYDLCFRDSCIGTYS